MLDKLQLGILFYKTCDVANLDQVIDNLALKFVDTYEVSQSMKDLVLKPFAQGCSLDATVAFYLLDNFFKGNYSRFKYFDTVDQKMK